MVQKDLSASEMESLTDANSRTVYWCPDCNRLHVSMPDFNINSFEIHKKEE